MSERTPDLAELQVRTLNALGLSLLTRSMSVTTIEEREVRTIVERLVPAWPRRTIPTPRGRDRGPGGRPVGPARPGRGGGRSGDVTASPRSSARPGLLADRRFVDFDEQVYRAIAVR